jgi:glucose-6-phosphate 1-epimerase
MYTPDIEQLNKSFSLDSGDTSLRFSAGEGNIPVIEIQNSSASSRISLQGAQVLSWEPKGEDEVIWVSTDASFALGKSVRGGIPICWPWFGPHEKNAAFPAHGFARTTLWQVIDTQVLSEGETQVTFELDTSLLSGSKKEMWPLATVAEYRLTIGKRLTMELTTFNHSEQAITIGQALHTYFNVDDIPSTKVYGLDGKDYLDKTDGFKRKTQSGPISIGSEVDRVYLNTPDDVIIDNKKRKIVIKKQGSRSTVVWNPWQVMAEKMGDLGKDGYLKMLCVESANAVEDTVIIESGESHKMLVIYELEAV